MIDNARSRVRWIREQSLVEMIDETSRLKFWALTVLVNLQKAAGFYRLRQLRRIRKSLDKESTATLVHAFVTSRVDYCNAVYAMLSLPQTVTNRLQRVMNAAARVVNDAVKFDRGTWTEGNFTRRAPLAGCSWEDWIQARCDGVPVSARTGTSLSCRSPHPSLWCCSSPRPSIQSANRNCLTVVPRCRLSTYGCLAFDYAPARQYETRCQMNLEIPTVFIVLNGS